MLENLDKLISEVGDYEKNLNNKCEEFSKRIASEGMKIAEFMYKSCVTDGIDDAMFHLEKCDGGYQYSVTGKEPVFVEFGAGIHFNGSGFYPIPKPIGVAGIGEYGDGHGKNDSWHYKSGGQLIETHGTPAQMPMYNSSRYIEDNDLLMEKTAEEVFKW